MKLRKALTVMIGLLGNVLLESVVFTRYNLWGARPDSIIVVIVSFGMVAGGLRSGLYGMAVGLILDILYSPYIGLYTISYMIPGYLVGMFTNQHYAQNLFLPPVLAGLLCLLKELLFGLQLRIWGLNFVIGSTIWRYFIPSAVLTIFLTVPIYGFWRNIRRKEWRKARWDSYSSLDRY